MAWQTPKTNWSAEDGVMAEDFNRIEGNIQHLQEKEVDLGAVMVQGPMTVYVSVNGSASGDGTNSNPYRYLNQAIAALPKNLNGHTVTIQITGNINTSITSAVLNITGFSNGRIALSAAGAGPVMMCSHNVSVSNGSIVDITGFTTAYFYSGLSVSHGALVYASCDIAIRGGALQALNYGRVSSVFTTTFMATSIGAFTASGGRIWMNSCFIQSDVQNGLWSTEGGVIAYGEVSNNAPTKTYTGQGGRILAGSQTTIPSH